MTYLEFEEEIKKLSKKQLIHFIDCYDSYVINCSFMNDEPFNVAGFYERFFIKELNNEKNNKS